MADEQSLQWGLFPRILVAAFAAMVVAIAAKPYEGKVMKLVNEARSTALREVKAPRRKEAGELVPVPLKSTKPKGDEPKSAKDNLTTDDKKALNSVLEGL